MTDKKDKVIISIDQWDNGISVSIGDGNFFEVVAGPHGGSVGECIKSFKVDADKIISIIEEYRSNKC